MAIAPMVVDSPKQIPLSIPVSAIGKGLTFTTTLLLFEQPVATTVSVKV